MTSAIKTPLLFSESNVLVADVNKVINRTSSRSMSRNPSPTPVYDQAKFPELSNERFSQLREAFSSFDNEKKGKQSGFVNDHPLMVTHCGLKSQKQLLDQARHPPSKLYLLIKIYVSFRKRFELIKVINGLFQRK